MNHFQRSMVFLPGARFEVESNPFTGTVVFALFMVAICVPEKTIAVDHRENSPKPPPNVILVITDDQGYKDVAAHGHPYIVTPNLDRLHAESVRLTDFHVRPTCAPTRAALMTGRAPMRSGIWHTIMGRSLMRGEETTMAELFHANHYRTGMFGKWHLGDNHPMRPQDQGFSTVVQHLGGGVTQGPDVFGNDYFDDQYIRNGKVQRFAGFCTDVWFDEAMKFIANNRREPFFVYLSTNAPHRPWNVAPEDEQVYLDMGVAKTAAAYYALITNIDHNVGRLMDRLDALGLRENTILIFMSDNGPAGGWPLKGDRHTKPLAHFTANMRGAKGSLYEGGHRVPCFLRWPAGDLGHPRDLAGLVADVDMLPTLAELADLQIPDGPSLDGQSIAEALRDKGAISTKRIHLIQNQRLPIPSKDAKTAILQDHWRLVLNAKSPGSVELYNVRNDRRQLNNVAEQHVQLTAELRAEYDRWWTSQTPMFDRYSRISLGSEAEPITRMMSHDWLTQNIADCVWHQDGVRAGQMGNGPWAIDVLHAGKYEFDLRRWPRERPGPSEADQARITVGSKTAQQSVDPAAESVVFELDLPAGPAMLQTWLRVPTRPHQSRGAYYVYVRRLPEAPSGSD